MVRRALVALTLAPLVGLAACTHSKEAPPITAPAAASKGADLDAWTLADLAAGAKLLPGFGQQPRRVSTTSADAQALFNQGLLLLYGFNHDEAARSFAGAAAIDPECAMCFWGVAHALGPNYNMPELPERAAAAIEALHRAEAKAPAATPVEAALIGALSGRIAALDDLDEPRTLRRGLEAHADAMRGVAARYPDDPDVQALFAESMMMLRPWHLWSQGGAPAEGTLEILAILARTLERWPDHIGANHFYIHAIEASPTPERGLPAAQRLIALNPAPGHLVHMPAHIFQRTGRYADAADANRRAIAADLALFEDTPPFGTYEFYTAHNYGFLAYAASMLGRGEESLAAARNATRRLPHGLVCAMPGMDFYASLPPLVMVRFGLWEAILQEPAPDGEHPTERALWHHARGMALASTDHPDAAADEAAAIRSILVALPADVPAGQSRADAVIRLAAEIVEARIAEARGDADAIPRWQIAVAGEDRLAYDEPADWFYPTRHYLGAALLDAGRPDEAEVVYREDLARHPENGWALYGLWRALEARGHRDAAAAAERRFRQAWALADVTLTRSAY